MRKIVNTLIIFLITITSLSAKDLKDLKIELEQSKLDSEKIDLNYQLAWELRKTDFIQAKFYANSGFRLSEKLGRKKDMATGLNRLGIVYKNDNQLDSAIYCYFLALNIESEINNVFGIARAYHQLSKAYKKKGDEHKALEYAELNHHYMLQSGEPKDIANSKTGLAILLSRNGSYERALNYFNEALIIYRIEKNISGEANVLQDLGNLYEMMEDYDLAIQNHKKSIELYRQLDKPFGEADGYNNIGNVFFQKGDYERAREFYYKSLELKKSIGDDFGIEGTNYNLALILEHKSEFSKAIILHKENEAKFRILEDYENLERTLFSLGSNYNKIENYQKAKIALEESYLLVKNSGRIHNLLEVTNVLSNTYSELGLFAKAFEMAHEYEQINNDLHIEYKNAKSLELEIEKRKHEEIQLIKDKEIAITKLNESELKRENNLIFIYGLFFFGTLVLISVFLLYKNRQQKLRIKLAERESAIKKQELEIQQQEFEGELKDNELNYRASVIEAQETERKKISEELHDNLGSLLSTIRLHFKNVEDGIEKLSNKLVTPCKLGNELLAQACEEIRSISHKMAAVELEKYGLILELNELFETIQQTGKLKIETKYYNMKKRLLIGDERDIYKTIRELITNIVKHANATKVFVSITRHNGDMTIMVEDDGVGFDFDNIEKGLGFIQIEQRVKSRNGSIIVDSGKGNGTTVSIDLSIKEN